MNQKRYSLAVYLLLAAIAVILTLVGLNYYRENQSIQALLINLSTELAGAVLIFFIVNHFFSLDQDASIHAEISELRYRLDEKFNQLISIESGRKKFQLSSTFENSESIDLLGYSLVKLLRDSRKDLTMAIQRGTKVRIMIVNQKNGAGRLLQDFSDNSTIWKNDFENALTYIKQIKNDSLSSSGSGGSIDVKLLSWIPSCSMIIVDKHRDEGKAKISFHAPTLSSSTVGRKVMILSHKDYSQDFDYFVSQFEILWTNKSNVSPEL